MNNILAKLQTTSESWIGSIVMVLNLVKLAGLIPLWIKIILLKIENDWKNIINQFCVDLRLTASPNCDLRITIYELQFTIF